MPVQRGENDMEITLEVCKKIMEQNGGNLDLSYSYVTGLPDGLVVEGNLNLHCSAISRLPENLFVGGWLDLSETNITSIPKDLSVGGWLDLSKSKIKILPNNLTVNGNLFLNYSSITSLPNNLTVKGGLYLNGTSIKNIPNGLKVGGNLGLLCTNITSLSNDLTVGGNLDLIGAPITSLPDNLTVSGYLDLSRTLIESLPDNLTVGGNLYLSETEITSLPETLKVGGKIISTETHIVNKNAVKKLKSGDYVPNRYLYADGMLTLVKGEKHFGKYTYYIGKFRGQNVVFDGKIYAHCKSFKEGVNDLLFKNAQDRGVEQYRNLTLESVLKTDEIITMYRVITGACKAGTERFVNSFMELQESYSIAEVIELTKGEYGAKRFEEFFKEN